MDLYSVFITGANRGVGLEFVLQFVRLIKPPKFVFATYRSRDGIESLKEIRDTSRKTHVLLIKMDVTKKNEVIAARKITEDVVGDRGLTLLINNAGVLAEQRFPQITEENLIYHFKTNTAGPFMVIQEFLPLLQKSAASRGQDSRMEVTKSAIVNISSALGSTTLLEERIHNDFWKCPSFSISKAALNMVGRIVARQLKSQGILVVNMCPERVKEDIRSESEQLEVNGSVSAMINTLATLNESHSGQFMDRNGAIYNY